MFVNELFFWKFILIKQSSGEKKWYSLGYKIALEMQSWPYPDIFGLIFDLEKRTWLNIYIYIYNLRLGILIFLKKKIISLTTSQASSIP